MGLLFWSGGEIVLDPYVEEEVRQQAVYQILMKYQQEYIVLFEALKQARLKHELHTYTFEDFMNAVGSDSL
jgi:hypothetical protein